MMKGRLAAKQEASRNFIAFSSCLNGQSRLVKFVLRLRPEQSAAFSFGHSKMDFIPEPLRAVATAPLHGTLPTLLDDSLSGYIQTKFEPSRPQV